MLIKPADLAAYRPLTINFARRELAARYKRSLLGWAWSVINPLSLVVIYSLVFGVFFRAPPPPTANGNGEFFSLYLFNGIIVWGIFTGVLTGSMGSMAAVSDMRKKVYFPAETAIFGSGLAVAVQSGLEMIVIAVIMAVLLNIGPMFLIFPIVLAAAGLFGLGLGLVASILNTLYRDVQHLIQIGLNLAFFLVPIVYTPEILPDEAYGLPVKQILSFHPMKSFITAGHDVVYFQNVPGVSTMLQMAFWTLTSLGFGLYYFRRRSMQISEEL